MTGSAASSLGKRGSGSQDVALAERQGEKGGASPPSSTTILHNVNAPKLVVRACVAPVRKLCTCGCLTNYQFSMAEVDVDSEGVAMVLPLQFHKWRRCWKCCDAEERRALRRDVFEGGFVSGGD